jgi:GntR family transcriptional regulator
MWISINEHDNRPIYQQIVNQVKEQVSKGTLRPRDELPSVRELAGSLGVNMHTVRSAYIRLRDQGIITLRLGRRARITPRPAVAANVEAVAELRARISELVTEARLIGLSAEEFRSLFDEYLEEAAEA